MAAPSRRGARSKQGPAEDVSRETSPYVPPEPPDGLGDGGSWLWRQIVEDHPLDPVQHVTLEEACRAKDRCDKFDAVLRGDVDAWLSIRDRYDNGEIYDLHVDDAVAKANQTANLMKQLLAALRLPDAKTGARPQQRGGARGAYVSGGAKDGGHTAGTGGSALGNLRSFKGGKSA